MLVELIGCMSIIGPESRVVGDIYDILPEFMEEILPYRNIVFIEYIQNGLSRCLNRTGVLHLCHNLISNRRAYA